MSDILVNQQRQDAEIESEQKSVPMISEICSPDCLKQQYEMAELKDGYTKAIVYLSKTFRLRRVRGDGNCFYRALLFSYLDDLLMKRSSPDTKDAASSELERITDIVKGSMDDLVKVGYNEFAIETFYDMFIELLEQLPSMNREALLEEFQEGGSGDHYTWYMRVMAAGYMKSHPDDFYPFIVGQGIYNDIESYCSAEVEPMGKECEQAQIIALTTYLQLGVKIVYVDGHLTEGEPITHQFPEGVENFVTLLYRPGHYDLLYLK